MKLLLIDIPSYKKDVDPDYRNLLRTRIQAEAIIENNKIGFTQRGEIPYSRGLLQIGSAISNYKHQVTLISLFDIDFWKKISNLVHSIDIVGITCMTPSFKIMNDISLRIKDIKPSLMIIAGGSHATYAPVETLREAPAIDVVIKGEGELIFVDLINYYPNLSAVNGIVYRKNSEIITNDFEVKDVLTSKRDFLPAYNLLERPLNQYSHNILTQRGCKYDCDYCIDANMLFRYSNLSLLITELNYLEEKLPANSLIYISDDVISSNKKRVLMLCDLICKKTSKFYFVCELRAEDVDEDILRALIAARFVQFNMGFEDMNDENLISVNRMVTRKSCINACELIRKLSKGLIGIHWITGLPNSTKESIKRNMKLIEGLLVEYALADIVSNKILVPYPGTNIYEQSTKYGIVMHKTSWDNFDRMSEPVFHTKELSAKEIWNLFLDTESVIVDSYAKVLGMSLARIYENNNSPLHSYNKFSYLEKSERGYEINNNY